MKIGSISACGLAFDAEFEESVVPTMTICTHFDPVRHQHTLVNCTHMYANWNLGISMTKGTQSEVTSLSTAEVMDLESSLWAHLKGHRP